MDNNTHNKLKSFFFKIAIITMSFCYVFGPAHHLVTTVLHCLSHSLEATNLFASNSRYNHHPDHHHHHHSNIDTHSHQLLDVIDKVLEDSNTENDSKKSEIVNFKLDKHINKNNFLILSYDWTLNEQSKYWFNFQKIHKGYSSGLIEPPQIA